MNGINFKPEMIQAIIERRKTQTRRVIKPQPFLRDNDWWCWIPRKNTEIQWHEIYDMKMITDYARYRVGETVYIKEAWAVDKRYDNLPPSKIPRTPIYFKDHEIAEDIEPTLGRWRSPLHLPSWYARYFITITDVRAERLQEISLADIFAEGCPVKKADYNIDPDEGYYLQNDAYEWFVYIWNSINKDYPWESNPFIFRYEFEYRGGLNE